MNQIKQLTDFILSMEDLITLRGLVEEAIRAKRINDLDK